MNVQANLQKLGYELPAPPAPAGSYLPYRRVGNVVHLAGAISVYNGKLIEGKVGAERTLEEAQEAARYCALNILAILGGIVDDFGQIKQVVTLNGFVNGVEGYADSPAVLNGASEFLVKVLGERGQHSRAAVTVAGLPKNCTVEIQAIVELEG